MTYLVSQLWTWLLSAFAVGVMTAILVRQPEERRWIARWMQWACLALLAASAVVAADAVAGRSALYVESAIASFVALILGGVVGTRFTGGSLCEHKGWALGLGPAGLIWLGACYFTTPALEADLKQRAGRVVESAGGDPLKLDVYGRDVTLPEDVADRAKLVDKILDVNGVRLVAASRAGKPTELAQALPRADKAASVPAFSGSELESRPSTADETGTLKPPVAGAPTGKKALEPAAAALNSPEPLAATSVTETASADAPASPQKAAAKEIERRSALAPSSVSGRSKAADVLAALPPSGELDAATCQAALNATVSIDRIEFGNGNSKIRFMSTPGLEKATALLKRCATAKLEVGVHMDSPGAANLALSRQRAEKLISYFERAGVAHGRLRGAGYGASKPMAPNATTAEGRAQNRRIEFVGK
jgi:outer membrane protein OmpA-like peptidoglycan-associated protein